MGELLVKSNSLVNFVHLPNCVCQYNLHIDLIKVFLFNVGSYIIWIKLHRLANSLSLLGPLALKCCFFYPNVYCKEKVRSNAHECDFLHSLCIWIR